MSIWSMRLWSVRLGWGCLAVIPGPLPTGWGMNENGRGCGWVLVTDRQTERFWTMEIIVGGGVMNLIIQLEC